MMRRRRWWQLYAWEPFFRFSFIQNLEGPFETRFFCFFLFFLFAEPSSRPFFKFEMSSRSLWRTRDLFSIRFELEVIVAHSRPFFDLIRARDLFSICVFRRPCFPRESSGHRTSRVYGFDSLGRLMVYSARSSKLDRSDNNCILEAQHLPREFERVASFLVKLFSKKVRIFLFDHLKVSPHV
jgi:hypothetical protein